MANPIWDIDGKMISWIDFNCPDDHLLNKLVVWNYECELYSDTFGNSHSDGLYMRGLALAKYIKHYYPTAIVAYYFDETHPLVNIETGEPMWKVIKGLSNES